MDRVHDDPTRPAERSTGTGCREEPAEHETCADPECDGHRRDEVERRARRPGHEVQQGVRHGDTGQQCPAERRHRDRRHGRAHPDGRVGREHSEQHRRQERRPEERQPGLPQRPQRGTGGDREHHGDGDHPGARLLHEAVRARRHDGQRQRRPERQGLRHDAGRVDLDLQPVRHRDPGRHPDHDRRDDQPDVERPGHGHRPEPRDGVLRPGHQGRVRQQEHHERRDHRRGAVRVAARRPRWPACRSPTPPRPAPRTRRTAGSPGRSASVRRR